MKAKRSEMLKQRQTEVKERKKKENAAAAAAKNTNVVTVIDQTYLEDKWTAPDQKTSEMLAHQIKEFRLNEEQTRAFSIVAQHATKPSGEQLKMYLGGIAGTGKSQVIKALIALFEAREETYRFICLAPTGAAAALIGGSTYHSALGFVRPNS